MAEGDILLVSFPNDKTPAVVDVKEDNRISGTGLNRTFSQDSLKTTKSSEGGGRYEIKNYPMARANSSYIPRKSIGRYGNALHSMMPYRRITTSKNDIPIDTVGCFNNASFSWVRQFSITRKMLEKKNNLPFNTSATDEKFLMPKSTYVDSCEVNGRRLFGIYKYEVQSNGQIGCSMFRVARKFCSTRIFVASAIHSIAILFGILGPALFLTLSLKLMRAEDSEKKASLGSLIGFSVGIFLCFLIYKFLDHVILWINLRTAMRFRTACVSSLFKKSMKSSIVYPIAPHQILSFINEESEVIFKFVEDGGRFLGSIIGMVWCFIAALILIVPYGMLPLFGVFLLFFIVALLGKISSHYYRKSILYNAKKLTVLEEFCMNFKNSIVLKYQDSVLKNFTQSIEKQFSYMVWSEVYSNQYSGHVVSAILIGSLFTIWDGTKCDKLDELLSARLILFIIYAVYVKNLFLEFCRSIQGLFYGRESLQKLKNSYCMVETAKSKIKPKNNLILLSISEAQFQWHEFNKIKSKKKGAVAPNAKFVLKMSEFNIPRGQFIAVTGAKESGKTTLLYSILGHTQAINGNFRQRGNMAYFPKTAFLHPGSIRSNIVMEGDFDSRLYYESMTLLKLQEDVCLTPGSDEFPIGELELSPSQVERIIIARALYSNRDLLVMDDPFSQLLYSDDDQEILQNVINFFRTTNRTILMATQNDALLKLCDRIYFLYEGAIYREGAHSELLHIPSYSKMLEDFRVDRRSVGISHSIDGSNTNNINTLKYVKRKHSRRHSNRNSHLQAQRPLNDDYEDDLLDQTKSSFNYSSILLGLMEFFMFFINYVGYFAIPIFMIIIVTKFGYQWWVSAGMFTIILLSFALDFISRLKIAWSAKLRSQSHQIKLFEKLLNTSLTFMHNFNLSDIIYLFSMNLFKDFRAYYIVIQNTAGIIVSSVGMIIASYWLALVIPVVAGAAIGLLLMYKLTLTHIYTHELDSRRKLYNVMKSNIVGRSVIQSFDKVNEFSKEFFELTEQNSTAIFMRKSVVYHLSFWIYFVCALGLWAVCLIIILFPDAHFKNLSTSDYGTSSCNNVTSMSYNYSSNDKQYFYVLAVFSYLCLAYNIHSLSINGICEIILSQHIISKIGRFEQKLTANELATNQTGTVNDLDKGLSVLFRDIKCSLSHTKTELEIQNLAIQSGEKILIVGSGSQLIVPIMKRILIPMQGRILLGSVNISDLTLGSLNKILEIVPCDPRLSGATVKSLITANHTKKMVVSDADIEAQLASLKLDGLVAKERGINQPISNLTRETRQLLCLARCYFTKPMVIVIEKPSSMIMGIMNQYIRDTFESSTIIFIGFTKDLFNVDRVINLNTLNSK